MKIQQETIGAALIQELAAKTQVSRSTLALSQIVTRGASDAHAYEVMAGIGCELVKVAELHSWTLCSKQKPVVVDPYFVIYRYSQEGDWDFGIHLFNPGDENCDANGGWLFGSAQGVEVLAWKEVSCFGAETLATKLSS